MAERMALYDLTLEELTDRMRAWGEPRFRANQIWHWLYRSLVFSPEAMINLPKELRERLVAETDTELLIPVAEQSSASGQTRKVLFRLPDGNSVESVLMRYHDRRTACISTQVGCAMGCAFCATGQSGFARNLSAGEIVAQVMHLAGELHREELEQAQFHAETGQLSLHPVSNVVLMGMGEPLANYAATWKAIKILNHRQGYGLGARQITLSTVGLVPGIRRMADEELPVNLALSLHAPEDDLRNQLVPIGRLHPLGELMGAVREYVDKKRRRVTIEYALIADVNDRHEHAAALAELLADILCHVNLIPLNQTPGSDLRPSPSNQVEAFAEVLQARGIPTSVRVRRGIDIEAGCGQLRRRETGTALA